MHVEVIIEFAQDESSILSTSNWLDSPYIQSSYEMAHGLP